MLEYLKVNPQVLAAAILASALRQPAEDRSNQKLVQSTKLLIDELKTQGLIDPPDSNDP